jgi:hypothetical protein
VKLPPLTEQERVWLMLGFLSCWAFIELHPELREKMMDDIENKRVLVSTRQAAEILALPPHVVKAATENAIDVGLVGRASDD